MPRPTMTYDLARAIAHDAANRQMRAAGRDYWNLEDYTLMVRTFDALWPVEPSACSP